MQVHIPDVSRLRPLVVLFLRIALATFVAAGASSPSLAQDSLPPWQGGLTSSLGQPSHRSFYTVGSIGFDWRTGYGTAATLSGALGGKQSIGSPVVGLLAVAAEAYAGARSTKLDGGIRAWAEVPLLRVSAGAEYNIATDRLGFLLGITAPVKRGGVFGGGSVLRAEWSTGALSGVRASVVAPMGQPAAGHTRPRAHEVDFGRRTTSTGSTAVAVAGVEEALANVRASVRRIGQLTVPFLDAPGPDPRSALQPLIRELKTPTPALAARIQGLDARAELELYHAELERAFSSAAAGRSIPRGQATVEGSAAAATARATLRDHLLYPYDRLLGQWKTEGTLAGLAAYARGNFVRDVISQTRLPPERESAMLYVFEELLSAVLQLERRQRADWRDSRLIWLPLQLGLRPEETDTQPELDAIVEAVVAGRFTDGNRVWYVINEQFQAEVIRSIQQAEDYHVLWIHDFRGRNDEGVPDLLSLQYVVDSYLRTMAQRVREYDRRRRLPVFMIFIDQHFYELNRGHIWLDVLERPLAERLALPREMEPVRARLGAARRELRAAVDSSRLLSAEAAQYGERWLANLIKVHVSVTNPADPSFRSRQILPLLGVPDNLMRDHRKIVFYDITEDDPYRGLAIYTGMGIGEHYAGPTWEDRALIVQGPAVLTLKAQARRLLEHHGIPPERIPFALRPRPVAAGYAAMVEAESRRQRAAGTRDQRALELHNQTGFSDKQVTVAKAVLYELMPPGSIIKAPDSLWGNAVYAALLTGSALRGCRVLIVAPSLASAPSSGWPQMGISHHLFERLIVLQQEFGPELDVAGGMLKTGIYNPGMDVQDVSARFAAAYTNARRTPFLRRLFPVHESVDTLLVHLAELAPHETNTPAEPPITPPPRPKLHLKANFFASREAWDSLVARPEAVQVLEAHIAQVLRTNPQEADARVAAEALRSASEQLEATFHATLTPEQKERVVYFLLIGSANADYRSMLMDGEASVLLSGWSGMVGLIDFALIMNLSVWIDDLDLLDALLPPPSFLQRAIARWVRFAL